MCEEPTTVDIDVSVVEGFNLFAKVLLYNPAEFSYASFTFGVLYKILPAVSTLVAPFPNAILSINAFSVSSTLC